MPYQVSCSDCDYDPPLVLKFVISAEVIAENHTHQTGHRCGIKSIELVEAR